MSAQAKRKDAGEVATDYNNKLSLCDGDAVKGAAASFTGEENEATINKTGASDGAARGGNQGTIL